MYAKKRFGQHFLHSQGVIDHIIELFEPQVDQFSLEIGPGRGALTLPLHRRTRLHVIEADGDMVDYLSGLAWQSPLRIIHADFMRLDLDHVIEGSTNVISNLPYQVSVPITLRLLPYVRRIPRMVMMYQREVAMRIRAGVGGADYGSVTVLCGCFYEVDKHFSVKPGAFRPAPKVHSQVIRMIRREESLIDVASIPLLSDLLRRLFGQRRKKIGTILRKSGMGQLLDSFHQCGYDPNARPQNVTPAEYAAWVRCIEESHGN